MTADPVASLLNTLAFGAAPAVALGALLHDHFDHFDMAVAVEGSASPAFHQRELKLVASSGGEDYRTYARWL